MLPSTSDAVTVAVSMAVFVSLPCRAFVRPLPSSSISPGLMKGFKQRVLNAATDTHGTGSSCASDTVAAKSRTTLCVSSPWSCVIEEPPGRDGYGESFVLRRRNGDGGESEDEPPPPLSPREWMESIESTEGYGGAYTVMRCDLRIDGGVGGGGDGDGDEGEAPLAARGGDSGWWRVWGQIFHLERLRQSFLSLVRRKAPEKAVFVDPDVLNTASKRSAEVIKVLLKEAESVQPKNENGEGWGGVGSHGKGEDDGRFQTFMLTLLWTRSRNGEANNEGDIVVRGHMFSTCATSSLSDCKPYPISAAVAAPTLGRFGAWPSLPNRCQSCSWAKLSSWCRERRPLEAKCFKPPGVSEVLMVRPVKTERAAAEEEGGGEEDYPGLEILEGLTSNFFAVYRDGTIRTAKEGVLFGYARHLVLEVAERCGLTVDMSPIFMQDALDGKWVEAFITSSSKLISPVERIVAPEASLCIVGLEQQEEDADDREEKGLLFKEFWKVPEIDSTLPWKTPRWEALYYELLREGGHDLASV